MVAKSGRVSLLTACVVAAVGALGCNSPAGMAVQLVGKAVDSVETDQLGKELIGQSAAAADDKLGPPLDRWHEVNGPRQWRVYPVSMDMLGNERCVVEVARGEIVAVTRAKIDATGVDLARKLMYMEKVQGKSPRECESALGMGRPLVTARSRKTGQVAQLYDAKMVEGVGSPQYLRLMFDADERCSEAALVDVGASTKSDPAE